LWLAAWCLLPLFDCSSRVFHHFFSLAVYEAEALSFRDMFLWSFSTIILSTITLNSNVTQQGMCLYASFGIAAAAAAAAADRV
jgi:hypothetical protein